MAAWLPIASGFTGFAQRFVDPALGFALGKNSHCPLSQPPTNCFLGWNYWLKYIIVTPNNIIAATLVIKFWFNRNGYDGPGSNPALYVAIILLAIIAINYFSVGFFGEFEFWLSSIKILILLGLILFSLVIACGGGPNHEASGFKYCKWAPINRTYSFHMGLTKSDSGNDPGAFAAYKLGQ